MYTFLDFLCDMMATQYSGAGVRSETLCKTEETDKEETATLKLKKKKGKKIQWTQDTVDNEGKNKISNKISQI